MARSRLAGLLHRPQDAADWPRNGPPEDFARRLFMQSIPFAHICRARLLLLDRKPEAFLWENSEVLNLAAALNCALALIYGHIHAAAAPLRKVVSRILRTFSSRQPVRLGKRQEPARTLRAIPHINIAAAKAVTAPVLWLHLLFHIHISL